MGFHTPRPLSITISSAAKQTSSHNTQSQHTGLLLVPRAAATPSLGTGLRAPSSQVSRCYSWCEVDSSEEERKPLTGLETEYEIVSDQLGFGATAKVMLGKKKATGELVAIKQIPKKFILDKEFKKIGREIKILQMLDHPNLIRYLDALISDDNLNIILEYAPGEELFEVIKRRRRLSEYEAAVIVRGVARGLEYIHNEGIVHADLKPENIIIDGPSSIKIIDFGLSRMVSTVDAKAADGSEAGGTLPYRAPELLCGSPSTPEADMWALGVILFLLLSGYPPFMSDDYDVDTLKSMPFFALYQDYNERLRDRIVTADFEYIPECWEGISSAAENLVRRLLSRCPEDRPTAKELLEDDWIVNLEKLPRTVPHAESSSLDEATSCPTTCDAEDGVTVIEARAVEDEVNLRLGGLCDSLNTHSWSSSRTGSNIR